MTEGDGGWSLFAGGAAIVDGAYRGTVITIPYIVKPVPVGTPLLRCPRYQGARYRTPREGCPYEMDAKIPRFRRNGGFLIQIVRPNTPSGNRQIRTTPDHTCFTRLSTSTMSDSLAPGTAGRPVGRFQLALRLAESLGPNWLRALPGYLAYSTALVSRMTLTLIWPGYSSSCSIFLAMSRARRIMLSSVTTSGLTMMRISRPAWMA